MSKEDVLNKAMQIVNQREKTYGKSCDNFQKAADLINAVLKDKLKDEHFISSTDVIFIMLQIKIARLINDPTHTDSQIDIAGYASLLSEVA